MRALRRSASFRSIGTPRFLSRSAKASSASSCSVDIRLRLSCVNAAIVSSSKAISLRILRFHRRGSPRRLAGFRRRSRYLHDFLELYFGGAPAAAANWQQHFGLTFNALARFLSLGWSRRPGFFAKAALQRVHQTDDIAGFARPGRADDALSTPLPVDQINESGFIMVFEFFWFKGAGLLFDNMLGEIEHVLCNLHILNLVEIFRLIANFVRIAQEHADQAFATRLQRDDMFSVREHDGRERNL